MEVSEIYGAQSRIKPYIIETPIEYSKYYSELIHGETYLKLESLQITGSFKIRGVLNKILKNKLINTQLVAASAGNHGKALAYASKLFRNKSTIFIPMNTPINKKNSIKMYGAELIEVDGTYDDAEAMAREYARETGATYVSPYNDIDIIYGQGTIALEIINKDPDIEVLVVPIGGGGLISGIGIATKCINPDIEIIGVQSIASPSMYESVKRGRITKVELKGSIAEGLHGNIEPGSITFDIVKNMVDEILLVYEENIRKQIAEMVKHHQQIIEGAAAASLAAIIEYPKKFRNKKICVILTGRNIDYTTLLKILAKYSTNY